MTASIRWRGAVRRGLTLSSALVLGTAILSAVAQPAHAHGLAPARTTPVQMSSVLQGSITPVAAGSPVASSVSRSADKLDVFGVDGQQRIYTTAWEPGSSAAWHRGTQINGGVAAPNTSVYAVSRRTDYLDVFAVGTDHHVYTAAWTPWSGGWMGWWGVGGLTVAPNTSVHAVSTSLDRLDIFAIGSDYGIYTNGWSPSTGWDGWSRVAGGVAAPGTTVYGVARHPGQLDIFAVGADHGIYTAARGYVGGAWAGWWGIRGGVAAPNSSVYPVSRSTDQLDIFAVGTDHHIDTAAWNPSSGWQGWWGIQGGVAAPNTTVFGVSRSANMLDVFAVGTDLHTYTAAWSPGAGSWGGWWSLADGVVAPGTSVFGVSRSADHLDVFAIGGDMGLYSAAWEPAFGGTGWRGWWQLGSGQINGNSLTFSTRIQLDSYDEGSTSLTVWSNGNYTFSGHFHESDKVTSYDVGAVWVLRSASGMAFTFSAKGTTAGTWNPLHSSTFDWSTTGNNAALAAAWPDLQNGYSYNEQASKSPDFAGMFADIKKVIGYIQDVVMVVGAL